MSEYGEYIVRLSRDWATKPGESLTKITRCRDCKHCYEDRRDTSIGWVSVFVCDSEQWSTSSLIPSHKV